ncbi:MAG: rhodanese-like domain-containing protein [Thermodesulfobacteriota bacterium]
MKYVLPTFYIIINLLLAVTALAADPETSGFASSDSSQKSHDYTLSRTIDAVLHKKQQGNTVVLADVRDRAEFDRLHILEAIHIPLYALKTKSYLKNDLLVLTNNGFNYGILEKEAGRLREQGFDVAILRGGINAWLEKGLPVSGDAIAGEDVWLADPADVYQEAAYNSFLPVNASARPDQNFFPGEVLLNPADQAADRIKSYNQSNPAGSVLVFNESGEGYPAIRKQLLSAGATRLFFLKGGLNVYKMYLDNLALSHAPREQRVKSYNKCKSCGDR